ncbi:MAG TPA: hypothetical protein VMT38_10785 [Terracidiphilus sp.]|nr:hypothetical protein [Terracidiphilus sp.]
MVALIFELALIAAGIMPLIATTLEPARIENRSYCGRLGNARRSR